MLESAYAGAARWIKASPPEGFAVDIFSDFGVGGAGGQMEALIQMRLAREIDRETFLMEARRRGYLSEDMTPADIEQRLQEETPALGMMGLGTEPQGAQP
jgi:hypothetical protein